MTQLYVYFIIILLLATKFRPQKAIFNIYEKLKMLVHVVQKRQFYVIPFTFISSYNFYCFTVHFNSLNVTHQLMHFQYNNTRVGTLIVATIYLQLIQNRYMFRIFTVLQCSHQHCVQPVASDVEVVGYL